MRILILGNGFDLEHGLETKYTDFLLFCECFLNKSVNSIDGDSKDKTDRFNTIIHKMDSDELLKFQQNLDDNYWIEYVLMRKDLIGDKWIDFEAEIYRKIREIDLIWNKFDTDDIDCDLFNKSKKDHTDEYSNLMEVIGLFKYFDKSAFTSIRSIRDALLTDLNRLILALELYFKIIVDSKTITQYNEDILRIFPDKVLSFNYTETYEKVYSRIHNKPECYHIHGKIGNDNIVLGIDEYLLEEERMSDTVFLDFQKYFQRLKKHTGNEHVKWLKTIEESLGESEVYFFGHSFGKSDGDIINLIISNKRIKTTVFYYDEETYKSIIENLIILLGTETMLDLVYGANPRIAFKKQSPPFCVS